MKFTLFTIAGIVTILVIFEWLQFARDWSAGQPESQFPEPTEHCNP